MKPIFYYKEVYLIMVLIGSVTINTTKAAEKVTPWNEREYHQSDYDMTMDIAQLINYNRSYVRNAKADFVPVNRTTRALNASFHLIKDLSRNCRLHVQTYKFASNEYRFFPLTVSVNLCEEYDRNLFNAQELMKRFSNIHGCPCKKGFYYVKEAMPDFSILPPLIPHGSYKMEWTFYHKEDFMAKLKTRGRNLEKPLWKGLI